MDYEIIKFATLDVFKECSIHSFPFDCFDILRHYHLEVYPYSSLNEDLREYCIKYSNDALIYKNKVCYNDSLPAGRIIFSLMHELGHILLKHGENHNLENEQEANCFASNILAPRMAIHYAGCHNQADVAAVFNLTNEASRYVFDDYKHWYRWLVCHKMSAFDNALYAHFYNNEADKFVYSIKQCVFCDTLLYNSQADLCNKCQIHNFDYTLTSDIYYNRDLIVAENQRLYGGL